MIVTVVKSGNDSVIRVTNGPEGEILMDLSGNQDLDITQIIKSLKVEEAAGHRIMLNMCRTRSEAETLQHVLKLGIHALYVTLPGSATYAPGAPVVKKVHKRVMLPTKPGLCSYCGTEAEILPIPGFMCCKVCAQIELGRLRNTGLKPA